MAQAFAHRTETLDGCINLLSLGQQHVSVYLWSSVGGEHGANLLQRKATGLSERYQCQLIEHIWRKASPLAC